MAEMTLFGRDVEIPDSLELYLSLKRSFYDIADLTRQTVFERFSDDDVRSACEMTRDETLSDGFSRWGERLARQSLQSIVKFGVKTLVERGCYSIDEEAYEDAYLDMSAVDECCESGLAMTNIRNLEEQEEARDEWRQSRSDRMRNMWAGGTLGGGIKGAIKGALTAEAMNIGGGLLSDAVNKIGSRRSTAKTVSRIEDLFHLFRCELAVAVEQAVRDSLDGFVKCLNENLGRNISGEWEDRDQEKARGILGNLISGVIPDAHREKAIAEMVCADPFYADAYDWIYRNVERLRTEVKRVSEYFCVYVPAIGKEEKSAS